MPLGDAGGIEARLDRELRCHADFYGERRERLQSDPVALVREEGVYWRHEERLPDGSLHGRLVPCGGRHRAARAAEGGRRGD